MTGLFFYKKDSSLGRLFIYKTSLGIVENNWLVGIGPGQFQKDYNIYQANYFRNNDINGREAYLADNTYYAFNDYLQIFAEQGLIGFLLFLFLICLIIKRLKKYYEERKKDPLLLGAVASLSTVTVSALFSYPLEIIPIIIYIPLWLSIIINYGNKKIIFTISAKPLKILGMIISIVLFTYSSLLLTYRLKTKEAFELARAGYIQKALKIHENLEKYYVQEGSSLLQYSELLRNTNQLEKAWSEIEKTKRHLSNSKSHLSNSKNYSLSASIAEEIGMNIEAERNYLMAIYTTPNRVLPRYEIMNFYLRSHQKEKALYWAESIKNMPVKVASQTTSTIQHEVSVILDTLRQ